MTGLSVISTIRFNNSKSGLSLSDNDSLVYPDNVVEIISTSNDIQFDAYISHR